MSDSLDITLMPLHRQIGQDQADLPGVYIAEIPRRSARGRGQDHLILYLALSGNAPMASGKVDQVLERLAQTFYKTPGSVTAALRTVTESLNQFLLDRNIRNTNTGRQATGLLTVLVVRDQTLYLSQSGPVHAFASFQGEPQHLYDPQISGRGLGLSRTAPIRYFQAQLKPGDVIVLSTQPSSSWNAASFPVQSGQGLEGLYRSLMSGDELDLNAVVLQARQGTGKVFRAKGKPEEPQTPPVSEPPVSEPPVSEPQRHAPTYKPPVREETQPQTPVSELPVSELPVSEPPPWEEQPQVDAPPSPAPEPEPVISESPISKTPPTENHDYVGVDLFQDPPAPPPVSQPPVSEPPVSEPPAPASEPLASQPQTPAPASRPQVDLQPARQATGALLLGLGRSFGSLMHALRLWIGRMLPNESMLNLPPALMGTIAVVVPVVVVSAASVVYIRRGLAAEYSVWYQQASQAASLAGVQNDQSMQRVVWETTLDYLDQAENYKQTEESQALRSEALKALDELNMVRRVPYQEAIIGGLPDKVKVTRLVIANDDLYMLDSGSGTVLRGRVTNSRDFEIDRAFQCGPGPAGSYLVGSIVDIAQAPLGSDPDAVVLAMDTTGSLLVCYPGRPPEPFTLARPQTAPNWGNLVAFTTDPDMGHFYLLDPVDQAVWAYWGSRFDQEPTFYFGDDVPDMTNALDLAVDKRDLYILSDDGSMTLCTYSELAVSPTRCAENMPYVDTRAGQAGQLMTAKDGFSQLLVSSPPDPSLYLLAPAEQAVYRFNLRTLNFHRAFLPANPLANGRATAFALNNLQRILYLAVDNHVYQAPIP